MLDDDQLTLDMSTSLNFDDICLVSVTFQWFSALSDLLVGVQTFADFIPNFLSSELGTCCEREPIVLGSVVQRCLFNSPVNDGTWRTES